MCVFTLSCCLAAFSFFNLNIPEFFQNLSFNLFTQGSVKGVKTANKYTIILVGDSMTASLGAGETILPILREKLPGKELRVLNYGVGSTNILSLPDKLQIELVRSDQTMLPILSQNFDVIIIESFGNNPLALPLPEALKKSDQALDEAINLIKKEKPEAVIIFLATIAPNRDNYAKGVEELSIEERRKWADERSAYIQNHIKYAKSHKIPLINVFDKSLKSESPNSLVNDSDFIHPSNEGLELIGSEIANFLIKKNVLR